MVLTLEQLRNGRRDVPFAGEESGATCQARDGADLAGFLISTVFNGLCQLSQKD